MLVVSKVNEDYFKVKHRFSMQYKERMNSIEGSKYEYDEKCYYVPMTSYEQFAFEFLGEIVFQTPQEEFFKYEVQDYKEKYELKKKYNLPNLKLKPYNYQEYGFNFMLNKLFEKGYTLNCDKVGLGD